MDQVVLGVCCLTFNSENWEQKQIVPMQAVEDFKTEGGVSVNIKYTWTTENTEGPSVTRRQDPDPFDPFGTGVGNAGVSEYFFTLFV